MKSPDFNTTPFGEALQSARVPAIGMYQVLIKRAVAAPRLSGGLPPHANSEILAAAFRKRGFEAQLGDARPALNYPFEAASTFVIPALPGDLNPAIAAFMHSRRTASLVWRPGTAQLPLLSLAAAGEGCDVLALCSTKAFAVTQERTLSRAVRALARQMPAQTVCVVTSPASAAAVRGGELVELQSLATPQLSDRPREGCGAAFTAGFVASLDAGASLATALKDGHVTAAIFIHTGQSLAALPDDRTIKISRALFEEPRGRFRREFTKPHNPLLRFFAAFLP